MKPAASASVAPAVVARRASRSGRKPAVKRYRLPPCNSPADIPAMFRALGRLGFMRDGRPEE